MNEIIILLSVGLVAGYLSGLVGIGGGIVIVPVLVYALSFTQQLAQGTTLFMFMFPIGILGVMQYYKTSNVDWKSAAIIAIPFVLGSFLGSKTALNIDQGLLKKIFGGIIVLLGFKMIFFK
ncbi:MAG: TSUP family transporter [Bacteroidota bacterium]